MQKDAMEQVPENCPTPKVAHCLVAKLVASPQLISLIWIGTVSQLCIMKQ